MNGRGAGSAKKGPAGVAPRGLSSSSLPAQAERLASRRRATSVAAAAPNSRIIGGAGTGKTQVLSARVLRLLLTEGKARRSLVVVLTDGRATGGPDPLGRTLTYPRPDTTHTLTVAGILADPPAQSTIRFDLLMPMAHLPIAYHAEAVWGMQQFEAVRSIAEECLVVFRSCGDQIGEYDAHVILTLFIEF